MTFKQKAQWIWINTKKTVKFVWRHCCTLYIMATITYALFVISVDFKKCLYYIIGAIFLDWFKMKWKFGETHYYSSEVSRNFIQQNWWNSSVVGTPAYLSDLGRKY